ncbi:MAG: hypothetical protein ICV87_07460, partial [Gemmatimonadetes bacterium]|nr:hypothetical protein [Gemmatimonadota bacterium]
MSALRFAAAALLALACTRADAQTPQDTTKPRPARLPLVIGSPTVDYTWTASTPVFHQTIPVSAADTLGDTVSVELLPLRGPQGERARVKAWFGGDTTATRAVVGRLGGTVLHLRADSGSARQYEGGFVLVTPRARTAKGFRVTWTRRGTGVAVEGAGTSAATLSLPWWLVGRARIAVPLTLADTSGAGVTLAPPRLVSLQRVGGDTALEVDFREMEVRGADGKRIRGGIQLPPDDSRRLRLLVPGIREAGRYTGKVRIAGRDAVPTTAAFTVYVRHGVWMAGLLILAGIGISEFIRRYQRKVRPRLVQRRRAAELLEALGAAERQIAATGGTTADQGVVIRSLREKLEAVYDDPDAGAPPTDPGAGAAADTGARLVLFGARVGLLTEWVNAGREVDAVRDDRDREDLARRLYPVRDALLGGTPEEVKAARELAHSLPAEIQAALKQRFLAEIAAFEKQVTEERAAHPTDDPFLASMDVEVQQRLADAATVARAGSLGQAAALYDEGRTAFADLLARELQLRLGQPAPGWLDAARWADLKREVQAALTLVAIGRTPEARILAFQGAHGLYLREMGTALVRAVDDKVAKTPSLTPEQKTALAGVRAQADKAISRVAARDPHGAATLFATAERAYRDLLAQVQPAGGQMMGPGTSAAPLGEPAAL